MKLLNYEITKLLNVASLASSFVRSGNTILSHSDKLFVILDSKFLILTNRRFVS